MNLCRRPLALLALAAALVPSAASSSCKPKDTGPADAAPEAAPSESASASASEPPPPLPPPLVEAMPEQFGGAYRCLGRIKLTQNGRIVSGRATFAGTDYILVCKAAGSLCVGTEITSKSGKVKTDPPTKRTLTLRRQPNGSLRYDVDGKSTQICPHE